MTGPEHYRRAEQLAAEAYRHLGQGEGQATAVAWAAVAQVHATLALAAATGIEPSEPRAAALPKFVPDPKDELVSSLRDVISDPESPAP